jgi:hypothetical protein
MVPGTNRTSSNEGALVDAREPSLVCVGADVASTELPQEPQKRLPSGTALEHSGQSMG